MKPILLCLYFLLMVAGGLLAQPNFAPPGAHWFNNGTDAYYHSYTDGDTVISGRTCTRIRRITHQSPMSWASDFPTICTYNSGDTVFVYNTLFGQFTPLYIFNVSEGDTIRIPRFDVGYPPLPATYFSYRVDSVRMITYDTAHLKTIFTYSLNEDSVMGGSDRMPTFGGGGTLHGAYAERIGGVGGGIFPSCVGCAVIPEDCGCIGPMRCYNDPGMDIKLVTPCAPPVNLIENEPLDTRRAYPNPAKGLLHINAPARSTILLMNLQGKTVQTGCDTNTINVTSLPAGVYLLRVVSENEVSVERVVVER
ncbi:MAG: T9SS type A sorting domain-containing protein [Chitinophagaceae bacterium]|nr:T9SS type A sorting domain-containing protein [Chitinophagaceae bacterium]